MTESPTDKVALVTGAGVRLGKEIALHLAKKGYKIALHYCSSEDQAQNVAQDLRNLNQYCQLFPLDFSQNNNYMEYLTNIQQRMGRLELIINSASLYTEASID
ncbi:MAG: SDR family NAD(P)-dependent oxidoreductase, partial [Tatlockia sp.]|nr:SDR family NAD(P)-dependent oxidoreductase [Tatlockia sp.]